MMPHGRAGGSRTEDAMILTLFNDISPSQDRLGINREVDCTLQRMKWNGMSHDKRKDKWMDAVVTETQHAGIGKSVEFTSL